MVLTPLCQHLDLLTRQEPLVALEGLSHPQSPFRGAVHDLDLLLPHEVEGCPASESRSITRLAAHKVAEAKQQLLVEISTSGERSTWRDGS